MHESEHDAAESHDGTAGMNGEADSGQLLGAAFHQRIAEAMEPVVETVRQHVEEIVQHAEAHHQGAPEHEAEQARAADGAGTGDAPAEETADDAMPQTILRSDKRAQDIWRRARDRAVAGGEEGRRAERAGYEALKRRYEKRGHRWVKLETDGTAEQASHARASEARSPHAKESQPKASHTKASHTAAAKKESGTSKARRSTSRHKGAGEGTKSKTQRKSTAR